MHIVFDREALSLGGGGWGGGCSTDRLLGRIYAMTQTYVIKCLSWIVLTYKTPWLRSCVWLSYTNKQSLSNQMKFKVSSTFRITMIIVGYKLVLEYNKGKLI